MPTSTELSPFDRAASASVYSVHGHFCGTAEVWEAYFRGQISQRLRESLLQQLRGRLMREVPLLR
jgi:hypothetical protein